MLTISSSLPIGVKRGDDRDDRADHQRDPHRRAGPRVDAGEPVRQQTVAAHREEHPDRTDHQRHHHGGQTGDGAGGDQRGEAVLAEALKAFASAASVSILSYFTIPVMTSATAM